MEILTDVVDESLDFRLHPPVSELYFAQLVCAHNRVSARIVLVLFDPVF